jgi:hypothetical protein
MDANEIAIYERIPDYIMDDDLNIIWMNRFTLSKDIIETF